LNGWPAAVSYRPAPWLCLLLGTPPAFRYNEAIGFDGELVAVETVGALRTWYCYVRPDTDAVQRLMNLAKAEELPAEAANDPTWEVVSHLS